MKSRFDWIAMLFLFYILSFSILLTWLMVAGTMDSSEAFFSFILGIILGWLIVKNK